MKNLIFICLALNLSGCYINWADGRVISKEPNQIEEILLLDSYLIYQDEFGMFSEDCAIQFQKTRVISFQTLEETTQYCNIGLKEKHKEIYGCYHMDNGWAGFEGSPTITYFSGHKNYENIVFHEFSHWAEQCMAESETEIELHANKEIWGFVESAPLYNLYENIKEEYK